MSIRDTADYKRLMADTFSATMIAEGVEEPDDEETILAAWQVLHDTRLAYKLQGSFGRGARNLLAAGLIEE